MHNRPDQWNGSRVTELSEVVRYDSANDEREKVELVVDTFSIAQNRRARGESADRGFLHTRDEGPMQGLSSRSVGGHIPPMK